MNTLFPFTLAGPPFLLFYAAFAAVVLFIFARFVRSPRIDEPPVRLSELTEDPYSIAYLRGGAEEAVRIAVFNLTDRQRLQTDGDKVVAVPAARTNYLRRPLDRALLAACATPVSPRVLHHFEDVQAACDAYEKELAARGLMPDALGRESKRTALVIVLVLLLGLTAARVVQALARGQTNLAFLLALTAIACFIAWHLAAYRLTSAGTQELDTLRTLTQRLSLQAGKLRSGGATNEAVLLAAVYGLYALPPAFEFVDRLFPRPRGDTSSSSSSGSSSGDSSCGGGGSGCGGCGGGGD